MYISNLEQHEVGPDKGIKIIKGNVNINVPNADESSKIVLRNLNIQGGKLDLNFGAGNVILENVKVDNVDISNVGSHSVYIKGKTKIRVLNVQDKNSDAHVVVYDDVEIQKTFVFTGTILETQNKIYADPSIFKVSSNIPKNPFGHVIIKPNKDNEEVILNGKFSYVRIEKRAKVKLEPNTNIYGRIDIESGVELEGKGINKVCINPTEKYTNSPIILKGTLNDVEILKKANIKLKKGSAQIIVNNVLNEIEVDKEAEIILKNKVKDIRLVGEGAKNIKESQEEKSKNCDIRSSLFNSISMDTIKVSTNGKEIVEYKLREVPTAKKVGEILDSLMLSSCAKAIVIDKNGKQVSKDKILNSTMQIRVIAEDQKTLKDYDITLKSCDERISLGNIELCNILENNYINNDENKQQGKITETFSFQKLKDEKNIEGYYIEIQSRLTYYNEFLPTEACKQGMYSFSVKDLDIGKDAEVYCNIYASYKNQLVRISPVYKIMDNVGRKVEVSTEGLKIEGFKDTNPKKGIIGGKIKFTKPNDEQDIKYYNVFINKKYADGIQNKFLTRINATGQDDYLIDIPDQDVLLAEDIQIVIVPEDITRKVLDDKSVTAKLDDYSGN